MKTLVVPLLLLSLGLCHGQCEVLNEDNLTEIGHCKRLYAVFEEALINNEINLFTLRQGFFSGKYPSSSMMIIHYHLQVNGHNVTKQMLWTVVSLFKYVHPSLMFMAIEPAIIAFTFNINVWHTINPTFPSMHLSLVMNTNETMPASGDIMKILSEITTKVRKLLLIFT